jgi:L-lactate dehydrogenase complex protein LldG
MSRHSQGGRDAVLARVREALSRNTDSHVKAQTMGHDSQACAPEAPAQRWLPPVGSTPGDRIERFARYCETLKTRFEVVRDLNAAADLTRSISRDESWQRVGAHHEPMVERCVADIGLAACWTDEQKDHDPSELEKCDAGITTCEALIAQTGSVLVTCVGNGGRALSVLPPHHVVIATADQLVPDLAAGYQVIRDRYGDNLPTQITFITGPSRTGDIERILVLGAHGPKRLTVILVDASAGPTPGAG